MLQHNRCCYFTGTRYCVRCVSRPPFGGPTLGLPILVLRGGGCGLSDGWQGGGRSGGVQRGVMVVNSHRTLITVVVIALDVVELGIMIVIIAQGFSPEFS